MDTAEIDEISKYCKENDLFLIEDTAEAHGIKIGNNAAVHMEIFQHLVFIEQAYNLWRRWNDLNK